MTMSETETSNGQSAKALSRELWEFCRSKLLSEEGLREIFERHELIPNNDYAGDYEFFLEACCNERINEGILQYLLEYFPAASRATNEDGITPLHAAFYNNKNVTLQIIQFLFDAAPDNVRCVDDIGRTPLHDLCERNQVDKAAIDIMKFLIEKYPEALRHFDVGHDLPIHLASKANPPEFCQVLIEAYPGSERIAGHRGLLPLHWACDWAGHVANVSTVEYLYKLYPEYPIHCAINGVIDLEDPVPAAEIVKFLLDCDPNVKLQKWEGHSLLHFASCLDYDTDRNYDDSNIETAIEVIKAIYDAHPEAINDDEIENDLHLYHQQVQSFINSELVYARQANDHRLMTIPDDNGQLPLHRALQNNAALGSIKLLVKGNPSALRVSDNNFAMPLHIACEHHDSACVVQYLLDLDMRTLRAVDIDNNTALHYACRGAKYHTIGILLEKFDAISVSKWNSQKKLPIDLLWESDAVEDRESVEYTECVFRLLKAYPETVMNVFTDVQSVSDAYLDQNHSGNGKKRKLGNEY